MIVSYADKDGRELGEHSFIGDGVRQFQSFKATLQWLRRRWRANNGRFDVAGAFAALIFYNSGELRAMMYSDGSVIDEFDYHDDALVKKFDVLTGMSNQMPGHGGIV